MSETTLNGQEVPATVRSRGVTGSSELSSMEKELRVTCPNDVDICTVSTEIPTIIKWLQSVTESDFQRVRVNDDGEIVSCKAMIPKGIIRLQKSARNSNQHNRMVSYGPARGDVDE